MVNFPLRRTPLWLAVLCLAMSITLSARADSAAQIDRDVRAALQGLYAKDAGAKALGAKAVAVLVFPNIVKAGLVVGGQYGEGALLAKGKTLGYYSTRAVSYGMQAGAQTFGYAMFLMTEKAYQHVNDTNGWEIGTGPSIVVMDKGRIVESGNHDELLAADGAYAQLHQIQFSEQA